MSFPEVVEGAKTIMDLAKAIPDLGRGIISFKLSREQLPKDLDHLKDKLSIMEEILGNERSWLSDVGEASCTQTSPEYRNLQLKIKQLEKDIKYLREDVKIIEKHKEGFVSGKFPLTSMKAIDKINNTLTSLETGGNDLYEKIREFASSREGPVTGLDGDDKYVPVTDLVPDNPAGMYFDFLSTDTDGKHLTRAGQLKAAILDESPSESKSVVAYGIGGAGKSCALRAIGRDDDIKRRFNGGVLYIVLGQNAGEPWLKDRIAKIVYDAGGRNRAKEIRELTRLDDVVDKAVPWFSRHSCLFLIDDIWQFDGITKDTLVTLSNLANHERSRIAYTMRDSELRYGMEVNFTPRDSDSEGEEFEKMLLSNAKLEYPKSEQARESFHAILRSCGGLPLALSIAGRAVHFLKDRYSPEEHYKAWHKYDSMWKVGDKHGRKDITDFVQQSLSSIDSNTDIHLRRFKAMCVLRKGQSVTLNTLSLLWNMEIFATDEEVKAFERSSIVRCSEDDSGELLTGLHDVISQISEALAREDDFLQTHCVAFIKRLLSIAEQDEADEASHASITCEGWVVNLQEFRQAILLIGSDKYLLSNLCWLLKLGGMKAELLWLVRQPTWIVKRLSEENRREVLVDIELASDVLSDMSMNKSEMQVWRDWLHRLTNCLQLSMSGIISNPHSGMAWFQLYGRLMYSKSKNSFVREFLQRIEEEVPKPWLKPVHGCLPPAGENLKAVVNTPGEVLHFVYQDGVISVISMTETELVNTVHDAKDGTELERYVLASDMYDTELDSSLSSNGKTFVCRTSDGAMRVWIFSTQAFPPEGRNARPDDVELLTQQSVVEPIDAERPKASKRCNMKQRIISEQRRCFRTAQQSEVISNKEVVSEIGIAEDVMKLTNDVGRSKEISRAEGMVMGKIQKKWECAELTGHTDEITCVAISGDGKVVVSGAFDGIVWVWENVEGKWENGHCLTGHTDYVKCVAVSGDGKLVVSASEDDTVRVWGNVKGKWEDGHCLTGYTDWVQCVAISGDGKVVVSGSFDNTVMVWGNVEGKWEDGHCLTGHTASAVCVAISGDGKKVVSGLADNTVRVWEKVGGKWEDGHCLTGHTNGVQCVAISEDGKVVVSGSEDHTVRVWGNVEGKWEDGHCLTGHANSVLYVAISGDGKVVVSGSYDENVMVWGNVEGKWEDGYCLTGHTRRVRCVAISGDGKVVVSGSGDYTVRVWENVGGKWNDGHCLTVHTGYVECVAISGDGKVVVSVSDDRIVWVWENVEGKWEDGHCLTGHTDCVSCVAISGDGKVVVSGSKDNTVRVWGNVEGKWEDGYCLTGHTDWVRCVAISGDGKVVVSGSDDKTVRVWGNAEGKWEDGHCLIGDTDEVRGVAISADGELISLESYVGEILQLRNRNNVWFLLNESRKLGYDLVRRNSEVESREKASYDLKSIGHSYEETLQKSLDGGRAGQSEKVTNLLSIESVSDAVRAHDIRTVCDGYCVTKSRAPYLLFINWEK